MHLHAVHMPLFTPFDSRTEGNPFCYRVDVLNVWKDGFFKRRGKNDKMNKISNFWGVGKKMHSER